MKTLRNFLGAAAILAVLTVSLIAIPTLTQAYCDISSYLSCRDTFDLQGCIDACPYVEIDCASEGLGGDYCEATDEACSNQCLDTGIPHAENCAAQAGCSMNQVDTYLRGGDPNAGETPPSEPPEETQPPTDPQTPPTITQPHVIVPPVETQPQVTQIIISEPPTVFDEDPPATEITITPEKPDEELGDRSIPFYYDLETLPWEGEDISEAEAIIDSTPQPIVDPERERLKEVWQQLHDQHQAMNEQFGDEAAPIAPKGMDSAYIISMEGEVEIDYKGRNDPVIVNAGFPAWKGSRILTGFDSKATIVTKNGDKITLDELTEVAIDEFLKNRQDSAADMKLDVHLGDMDLDVNTGNFTPDVQVKAGNPHASVRGTHFGVSYDPETELSVFEIYDGTIEVTSPVIGKTIAMTSSYGEPIKRVEIGPDGEFVQKIAIPTDEWYVTEAPSKALLYILILIIILAVPTFIFFYSKSRKK